MEAMNTLFLPLFHLFVLRFLKQLAMESKFLCKFVSIKWKF